VGRKKQLENRADIILQSASELFSEYGYDKTVLDEVAERAGVSKGSIYLEFDSKEEILFALIERDKEIQLQEMRRLISKRTAQKTECVLDILKAMLVLNVGSIYESVQRNRRSPEEMMQSRERLRARLQPFFEARLHLIQELLEQAYVQGEILTQRDFSKTAQLIMMVLRAVLPPYEPSFSKFRVQHDADMLLEFIFDGLRSNGNK
jgi:AcrR family transcriptional regulator